VVLSAGLLKVRVWRPCPAPHAPLQGVKIDQVPLQAQSRAVQSIVEALIVPSEASQGWPGIPWLPSFACRRTVNTSFHLGPGPLVVQRELQLYLDHAPRQCIGAVHESPVAGQALPPLKGSRSTHTNALPSVPWVEASHLNE
jgi:hypothetical protein